MPVYTHCSADIASTYTSSASAGMSECQSKTVIVSVAAIIFFVGYAIQTEAKVNAMKNMMRFIFCLFPSIALALDVWTKDELSISSVSNKPFADFVIHISNFTYPHRN